ncbi:MAG: MerR family transcriptional regulator [Pseudomonadota bacterium]
MEKSRDAFRTISEVAEGLGTQPHVLRFWESKFSQVKPVKRAGGRRYYRPGDVALLTGIKKLLHDDGITIKGVQKILRERGVKYVTALVEENRSQDTAPEVEDAVVVPLEPKGPSNADVAPTEVVKPTKNKSLRDAAKRLDEVPSAQLDAVLERLKALHTRLSAN